MFTSLLLFMSFGALAFQLAGIGSAAILFTAAFPILGALSFDRMINTSASTVSLVTYVFGQVVPLIAGTELITTVFDVFVPLVSA